MATTYIDQSQTTIKNTKKVETEIKNSVQNINVDLSKIDMSGAIGSFKNLEQAAQAANFTDFIGKVTELREVFVAFQKSVQTANTSVTNFSKSADKVAGLNTAVVTNVEIDAGGLAAQAGEITANIGNVAGAVAADAGSIAADVSSSVAAVGNGFSAMGAGVAEMSGGVAAAAGSLVGLLNSVAAMGNGLVTMAGGVAALIPLLPLLGESILQMAVNMAGVLAYLPELTVFLGVLLAMSLLGEGLAAAGNGLVNIGLGLTSMTAGMTALLTFMPVFIDSLAGITANIGGVLTFVLLAAAMLVMAIALQTMNEQMTMFVENMEKLTGLVSVGFVAAFVAFGAVLIAMSFFMDKVAGGLEKITQAMSKQIGELAILNPLLATQAILTNPIVGVITVAAAVAGGLLVKALLPAMATGGVVSSPTVAMIGEGRYPEAVVPLGNSPQFDSMKTEIANAVLRGVAALGGRQQGSAPLEIVLNLDGEKFARAVIPQIDREHRRRGYSLVLKEV